MKKILILLSVVLLLTSCTSPSSDSVSSTAVPTTGSSTAVPVQNMSEDEKLADYDKFNFYVAMSDWMTEHVMSLAAAYFNYFGIEEEPVIDASVEAYELADLDAQNWEYITAANDYAAAAPSYGESDAEMIILSEKVNTFLTVYDEVSKYYSGKEYVNDSNAKSAEYQTRMLESYIEMWTTLNSFYYYFEDLSLEKQQSEVISLKDSGMLILSYSLSSILEAKKIEQLLMTTLYQGEDFLKTDLEEFRIRYESFAAVMDELKTLSQNQEQLDKEEITGQALENFEHLLEDGEMMGEVSLDILKMIEAGTVDIFEIYTTGESDGEKYNPVDDISVCVQNMSFDYNYIVN